MNRPVSLARLLAPFSVALFGAMLPADLTYAEVSLPEIFGDNMVLQRGEPLEFWGTAAPGERVSINFAGRQVATTANGSGEWRVAFPSLPQGGPHSIAIQGVNQFVLKNVMLGDVWLCVGRILPPFGVYYGKLNESEDPFPQGDVAKFRHAFFRAFVSVMNRSQRWVGADQLAARSIPGVALAFARTLYDSEEVSVGVVLQSPPGREEEVKQFSERIAHLARLPIRGVLWLGGPDLIEEARYEHHLRNLTQMIRRAWRNPSLFVCMRQRPPADRRRGGTPRRWIAMVEVADRPNCAAVPSLDVFKSLDNLDTLQLVTGVRMAHSVLNGTYGGKFPVRSGATFRSAWVRGEKVYVRFAHVGSGLRTSDGGPPRHFELAGADGVYHPARATVSFDTVALTSREVADPRRIRFARTLKQAPNLTNSAGWPAFLFETTLSDDSPDYDNN